MMYWNGEGGWATSGGGYVLMVLGMLVFWGLAERFARGEIDGTEFASRLATLPGQPRS